MKQKPNSDWKVTECNRTASSDKNQNNKKYKKYNNKFMEDEGEN
jgi:hypothetical protein